MFLVTNENMGLCLYIIILSSFYSVQAYFVLQKKSNYNLDFIMNDFSSRIFLSLFSKVHKNLEFQITVVRMEGKGELNNFHAKNCDLIQVQIGDIF